jgi:hypothetical protein
MGGLYSPGAVHEYAPIREMAGAAYYLVQDAGRERAIPNPKYTSAPPIRWVTDLPGTRFAPPDAIRPLWSSFAADPQRYAFITNPALAAAQFAPQDLKR